jgi:hypothetical protein
VGHSSESPAVDPNEVKAEAARRTGKSGTFSGDVGHSPESRPVDPNNAEELTPQGLHDKQMRAMLALLHGKSNTDAAEAAGVDRRTVFRWRQQPKFVREMQRVQSCFCNSLRTTAADLMEDAVRVIEESLGRGNINAALDLLKATKILGGQPLTEIDNLDAATVPDAAVVFHSNDDGKAHDAVATNADALDASDAEDNAETVKSQIPPEVLVLEDLPPNQQLAIEGLLAGKPLYEAAERAQVTFATLERWMRTETNFRQVLRTCRQQQAERVQTKLLNLGTKSLVLLRLALQKKRSVRVAFAILSGLGVLK